jgi:hypothetical protein
VAIRCKAEIATTLVSIAELAMKLVSICPTAEKSVVSRDDISGHRLTLCYYATLLAIMQIALAMISANRESLRSDLDRLGTMQL